MKKIIVALLLTSAISALFTPAKASEEHACYPMTGGVYGIHTWQDEIEVITATGHIYAIQGVEDWQYGDIVSFIMLDTKGTSIITDDVMIDYRYSGSVEDLQAIYDREIYDCKYFVGDEFVD